MICHFNKSLHPEVNHTFTELSHTRFFAYFNNCLILTHSFFLKIFSRLNFYVIDEISHQNNLLITWPYSTAKDIIRRKKKNFKIIDELSRIEFCIETIYAITYPPFLYR